MFFPFKDYYTVPFDFDDGVTLLYTTTSKCLIEIELTNIDIDSPETVHIYANNYGSVSEDILLFSANASHVPSGSITGHGIKIFPSGVQIYGNSVDENNVQGLLHIFELPTSP